MGFAVRVDADGARHNDGSSQSNLVSLHSPSHVAGAQSIPDAVHSPASKPSTPAEVKQLPTAPRLPLGLKLLVGLQQGSTIFTGGLVAAALVIYSWTVYLDKSVARAFRELEVLKVSTQQVTTVNETLKHSMAEQAESPTAGFKPFEPKRAIFLAPAPVRPSVEHAPMPEAPAPMSHPLGY
ncbi:hypothetical protein [Leptothoe kymatousa]|uniref:Uncharacterized protein n=1 Tax=Leptothoe kymatousa TAU-MAC 1615 TaxID=2364775 RepID=A0ABS5Y0R1_9CYAN|nr:hypothetical protein [Leptothoe kymatousa]MBT9311432.1 hypothetical protein [Leptothoe kymatousa TAU-MAC 1615]